MAVWEVADDLRELAQRVIAARSEVAHVDIADVLFVREYETSPKALARCFRLADHPIGVFTPCRFAIVFYEWLCGELSERQRAIVMWHELMHIPLLGDRLVEHDVKDFVRVLGLAGIDWQTPGADVPDILGG